MARRNLRKWAEAKQRRAEQHAPLRGHWISSANGMGIFLEDPDPPFGTYCTPTRWLPMCDEPPTLYLSRTWRDRVWAEAQRDPGHAEAPAGTGA